MTSSTTTTPFISVCTPTFNRRPFFPTIIKCFDGQTYPKDKMEWIIVDDGTDKIEDIVKDHPLVKYFKYDEKMPLGKKRNIMHQKAHGSIIVYMDDDDYYPPERVSHAVEMLVKNPEALCAGSSEMYIYFKDTDQMIQFGPYGPNHATAGTFAFRKELLREHKYNNDACLAEEREFLKGYTVPFVQLDPMKTILVFSHRHNTFDKRTLLNDPFSDVMRVSKKTVGDFIKDADVAEFFINLDNVLIDYPPGEPEMKPDVIKETKILLKKKEEIKKNAVEQHRNQQELKKKQYDKISETNPEIFQRIQSQQQQIHALQHENESLQSQLHKLKELYSKTIRENMELKKK
uniref:Glycosyltransferase 2-like domain-containing protein n=1 Tax=viral metagenome TaxID=1070528 RepID=A0A6C0I1J7_9ZZZZ